MKIIVPARSFARKNGHKAPSGAVTLKVTKRSAEPKVFENNHHQQVEIREIYTFEAFEGKKRLELSRELAFGFPKQTEKNSVLYMQDDRTSRWEESICFHPLLAVTSAPVFPEKAVQFGPEAETFGGLLAARLTYPQEEYETGVEGKVYAQFIFTEYGQVAEAKILKKGSPGIDHAVLKAIKRLPDGFPAFYMDEFIPQTYVVLVTFDSENGISVKEPEPGWQKPESSKVFYIRWLGTYAITLPQPMPSPDLFPE